mmetsp:Transcript_24355/g.56736  ORF Transcript_24355/g.56736 Transcript_24355/m.56736 type:complete len:152 (+) Transcript_24355:466-921(+)
MQPTIMSLYNVLHVQQGVYKPFRIRFGWSRGWSSLAVFVASGLLHEYVWWGLFYVSSHETLQDKRIPTPVFGKSMLFFGWNGILVWFENEVIGKDRWNAMVEPFPPTLVSMVVVGMVLPVAHFFTADFTEGGFLPDFSVSLPLVVISAPSS